MTYEIDVVTIPARLLTVSRFHMAAGDDSAMGERMGAAFGRVMATLRDAHVVAAGPPVARFVHADGGFDVAAGFPTTRPVDDSDGAVVSLEVPETEVAHTTHVGPYSDLPKAYEALRTAVEAGGRRLDRESAMWEEYMSGPEVPPERTRTEVYWPLAG